MQGSFTSEMEWSPFKCLFWNANDLIVKLVVSLWYILCYRNMLNYDNDKKCRKLTTIQKYIFFGCRADAGLGFEH